MLSRLRRHLNPGTVIGTVALFVALGGGYATAFSGSGTLQKGALKNIPSTLTTVRTLTGVGAIRASCTGGVPTLNFLNQTGQITSTPKLLVIRTTGFSGVAGSQGGNTGFPFDPVSGFASAHIGPTDGTKSPQINLEIGVEDTNDCSTTSIDVLALNTQQ